ncbi:MAG: hypothetical protein PHN69_03980 [Candidatus Pacebacteria bacterium]|nr:hypothetical protein [Fermentimonas sp.]MDD4804311.1 hypothetical protein [Candidatus Paceibacterota bacterium]
MVEEVTGWKTKYGSMHSDKDSAIKAENEEMLAEFSNELRIMLGLSPTGWNDSFGPDWAKELFNARSFLAKLCIKYGGQV